MKKCPNCKLINPDEAVICDCGYNFEENKTMIEKEISKMDKIQIEIRQDKLKNSLIIYVIIFIIGIFLSIIHFSIDNYANFSRSGSIVSSIIGFTGIGLIVLGFSGFKSSFKKYKSIKKAINKNE